MSEIYIVVISDRHSDIEVQAFDDLDMAIDYARKYAQSSCSHSEDYQEYNYEGYEFFANYSCESDYTAVYARNIIEITK